MFEMYLEVPGRLICTGQRYDSLQDSKTDYPWSVFVVRVEGKKLIAQFKTNKNNKKYMKGVGPDGWCY